MSYTDALRTPAAKLAQQWLGSTGACLGSITGYKRRFPDHEVRSNQVLVLGKDHVIWCGDLDFTLSEPALRQLAACLGLRLTVHRQAWCSASDRRFFVPTRVYEGSQDPERLAHWVGAVLDPVASS